MTTPRDDGFRMPAEWVPHQATLMAWPTRTREGLWGQVFERAKQDYAAIARVIAVLEFEPTCWSEVAGTAVEIPYLNCYLANGAVIMPMSGMRQDEEARVRMAEAFPDREVVCVPGAVIAYGGGGPHCITQQVPAGEYAR